MVKQVSQVMALSNSGLSDWVVQRSTAVILTVYFSWVMAFSCSRRILILQL